MIKRGASNEIVADNCGLVEFEDEMRLMSEAHANVEAANAKNTDEIADIDNIIREQKLKRSKLDIARQDARREASADTSSKAALLQDRLNDPKSTIHPVMRAVLLAPSIGTGSLDNPNTFDGIKQLALDMLELNDSLESREEPQPAVLVSETFYYQWQQFQSQVDIGYTSPGRGLSPRIGQRIASWHSSGHMEFGPQPLLTLPMQEETINAVSPSSNNSHYIYANQDARFVNGSGKSEPIILTSEDFVPEINPLELPLPASALDTKQSAKPFVYFDNAYGGVEVIETPKALGNSNKVVCAIGENAILHLLTATNLENTKLNAEQRRVLKNMSLTIAHQELGLSIKRGDFLRNSLTK
jgi:hypothetical protein